MLQNTSPVKDSTLILVEPAPPERTNNLDDYEETKTTPVTSDLMHATAETLVRIEQTQDNLPIDADHLTAAIQRTPPSVLLTTTPAPVVMNFSDANVRLPLSQLHRLSNGLQSVMAGIVGVLGSLLITLGIGGGLMAHDFGVGGALLGIGAGAYMLGILIPVVCGLAHGICRVCMAGDNARAQGKAAAANSQFTDKRFNDFLWLREWGGNKFLSGLYKNDFSKAYTQMPYSGSIRGGLFQLMYLELDIFTALILAIYFSCKQSNDSAANGTFSQKLEYIVSESYSFFRRQRRLTETEAILRNPDPTPWVGKSDAEIEASAKKAGQEATAATAVRQAVNNNLSYGEAVNIGSSKFAPSSSQLQQAVEDLPSEDRAKLRM